MKELITSRKLRSRVKKLDDTLIINVKDISVNGVKRGCSGFITDSSSGNVVYINTEGSEYGPLTDKIMYRKARDIKDYSGGRNIWAHHSTAIHEMVEFIKRDFSKEI